MGGTSTHQRALFTRPVFPSVPLAEPLCRQRHARMYMQRNRVGTVPRAQALAAAADVATPVIAELARRVLALSSGNPANTVAHVSEVMQHQAVFIYSLAVTFSISVGAWIVAAARLGEALINQQPAKETVELYGVDVTFSRFLSRPKVIEAANFAAKAHSGQTRLTGAPYISHCVETALIVEGLWALSEATEDDERVEVSVIAALLHDVVDDTSVSAAEVEQRFGSATHALVVTVTRLSQINQLIRRKHRRAKERGVEHEDKNKEVDELRDVILTMCDEPFAILIKLADRLHNMRTVYALPPHKAQAVASETLHIWCSLAERLGMFAVKSELEDLCFAVLHPVQFAALQADLERWWGGLPEPTHPVVLPAPRTSTAVSAPQRLLGRAVSRGRRRWPNELFQLCATGVEAATTAILQQQRPYQPPEALTRDATPSSASNDNRTGSNVNSSSDNSSSSSNTDTSSSSSDGGSSSNNGTSSSQKETIDSSSSSSNGGSSSSDGGSSSQKESSDNSSSNKSQLFSKGRQKNQMKALVVSVPPFHHRTFKSQRSDLPYDMSSLHSSLATVEGCGRQLLLELTLNGQASGVNIEYEGRLKSLYSIHMKMARKQVALDQIYDSRALRIVVDDGGSRDSSQALRVCYQVRTAVQRLWKPIHSERDDYIANPKGAGGYQSLHMAVVGPGDVPMEIQLRTSSMHADAEYGAAAHWAYKEGMPPRISPTGDASDNVQVGQAVLQVDSNGTLSDGIILEVHNEGRRLLVAQFRRGRFAAGSARAGSKPYRNLKEYVEKRKWNQAGQVDSNVGLLSFVKCLDGSYHMQDAYGHNHSTSLVPLMGHIPVEETASVQLAKPPKWPSAAAAAQQPPADAAEKPHLTENRNSPPLTAAPSQPLPQAASGRSVAAADRTSMQSSTVNPSLNPNSDPDAMADVARLPTGEGAILQRQENEKIASQKTRMLRAILEWGNELNPDFPSGVALPAQVLVLMWPPGDFKSVKRGTTAGQVIQDEGLLRVSGEKVANKGLVNVNNTMVPPDTALVDGDVIFRTDDLVDIN